MAGPSTSVSFGDSNTGFLVGVNSGSIQHNEFHLPPERPESRPQPSTNVPFRRNRNFVERAGLLDQLDTRLSIAGGRVALVGLGGIGKTQQAVEYTYRVRQRSPDTWVLWINATSRAQFEQSIRSIADRARIEGRNDPNADISQLFRAWLEDTPNDRWLVILDNADDAGFLVERPPAERGLVTRSLFDCLPVCEHGAVLITSRSRSAALKLVEHDEIVRIDPMHEEGAVVLLGQKLGDDTEIAPLKELAAALEYIPLAMIQAASYVKRREWRSSVQDYLRELQRSDESQTMLLDGEADTVVMRTWLISFEHISRTRKSAADLLSIMSLCDRQGIPELLLRGQDNAEKRRGFDEDIEALLGFSFIGAQVSSDGTTFEMHRLVQLATRKWRAARSELNGDVEAFVCKLDDTFPLGAKDGENWDACQAWFPHVKSAMGFAPDSRDGQLRWASVMSKAAEYASSKGGIFMWRQATEMTERCWETRKALLGEQHRDTLVSMRVLADCYAWNGEYKKSAAVREQCLKMLESTLGERHRETLLTMCALARAHNDLGDYERAKDMAERCWKIARKEFGENDGQTLQAMTRLAWSYHCLGDDRTAAELGERCCEIAAEELGEEHIITLDSMGALAVFYSALGESRKAVQMGEQCLKTRIERFGEDHPTTLLAMMNLADDYYHLGDSRKAIVTGERCWEMQKRKQGDNHPGTLGTMGNLAVYLRADGQIASATLLLEDCVARSTAKLGSDYPITEMRVSLLKEWQQPTPRQRLRDRVRRMLR